MAFLHVRREVGREHSLYDNTRSTSVGGCAKSKLNVRPGYKCALSLSLLHSEALDSDSLPTPETLSTPPTPNTCACWTLVLLCNGNTELQLLHTYHYKTMTSYHSKSKLHSVCDSRLALCTEKCIYLLMLQILSNNSDVSM